MPTTVAGSSTANATPVAGSTPLGSTITISLQGDSEPWSQFDDQLSSASRGSHAARGEEVVSRDGRLWRSTENVASRDAWFRDLGQRDRGVVSASALLDDADSLAFVNSVRSLFDADEDLGRAFGRLF